MRPRTVVFVEPPYVCWDRRRDRVRELVPPLLEDRPLGADVERLAGALGRVAG